MKSFRNLILICILGLLYSSCAKKENYPDVPVISYTSFSAYYEPSSVKMDSAILIINFTDGNGDIGYPSGETDASPDLYVTPLIYYRDRKTYLGLLTNNDTLSYPYTIPYITPAGNDKELSGIIKINMENFLYINIEQVFLDNPNLDTAADPTKMEFKVWMFDRAGNKSNVLITPVQNVPL